MVVGRLRRLEAALALMLAWLLVFLVPLRLLGTVNAPGARRQESPDDPRFLARAQDVARRANRVADRLPWRSTCLVRAVAVWLLLRRRGSRGAAIRLGVRRQDGLLRAHAWLLLGGTILTGAEEADGYVPLADFSVDRKQF
jgi:hypothetical protein